MHELLLIEEVDQAEALLKPLRVELLKRMSEPRTCSELAEIFSLSPQSVYYHVKELEKAGLVEKVAEARVRGTVEGHYQARARAYWLSPQLVGQLGGPRGARHQASLRYLLSLAEELHTEIGRLGTRAATGESIPTLGLSAQIHLPDGERRGEFLAEIQQVFQAIARKYGLSSDEGEAPGEGETFHLVLACYPAN